MYFFVVFIIPNLVVNYGINANIIPNKLTKNVSSYYIIVFTVQNIIKIQIKKSGNFFC